LRALAYYFNIKEETQQRQRCHPKKKKDVLRTKRDVSMRRYAEGVTSMMRGATVEYRKHQQEKIQAHWRRFDRGFQLEEQ
jgi:hypothetical protein